jgi:hypothetical protein
VHILGETNVEKIEKVDPDEPSVTRGANFFHEAMRVGPEETGLHLELLSYNERKRLLGDMHEYMRFCRELWSAFDTMHLSQPHPSEFIKP